MNTISFTGNKNQPKINEQKEFKNLSNEQKEVVLLTILNAPDEKLKDVADFSAYKDNRHSSLAKVSKGLLYAIPVIHTLSVASKKASLTGKMAKGALTAAGWGIFFGIDKAYKKTIGQIPAAKNFNKENPLTSIAVNAVGIIGISALAINSASKLIFKTVETKKGELSLVAKDWIAKPYGAFKAVVEKSKNTNKINETINKISKTFNNKPVRIATDIAIGGILLGGIIKLSQTKNKAENNYTQLKTAKEQTTKALINHLAKENSELKTKLENTTDYQVEQIMKDIDEIEKLEMDEAN